MAWVIDQCLILLHPTMPFITEELWGEIAERPKMLVHADWPDYGAELIDAGGRPGDDMGHRPDRRNPLGSRARCMCLAGLKVQLDAGRARRGGAGGVRNRNRAMIDRLARLSDVNRGSMPCPRAP